MNNIQIFSNEQFGNIRIAGTSDNPLFCLAGVCRVLELRVDGVIPRLKRGGYNRIESPIHWGENNRHTLSTSKTYIKSSCDVIRKMQSLSKIRFVARYCQPSASMVDI